MSAHVFFKHQPRALRCLPLTLLAVLALAGPAHAQDDPASDHSHRHDNASAEHDHGSLPAPEEQAPDHPQGHNLIEDRVHAHVHTATDHGEGVQARQAPQEWLERPPPIPPSADNLAFGQEVYQRYCAACHGSQGRGDGVAAGVAGFVPAPTDLARHGAGHAAGEYAWQIDAGNPQSAMPRFGGKLDEEDLWAVVLYIRHVLAADGEASNAGDHAH